MAEHITIGPELIGIRRRLHADPELGFHEERTSRFIAEQLRGRGIAVLDNPLPSKTGVIGLIEGGQPGPFIALRADIDALPVAERSGMDYSSRNEGVMHACGHDLHMTSLLAAAFWLAGHRERIAGRIMLLFQPAEETGEGALAVLQAGVVDGIDAIIGAHNNPDYLPGQIAVGTEPMMAGCVKFAVRIHAQGTHAGYPHMGTGPIEALASMILSVQSIVSRNATPFHPLVVSITQVHGGDVWNVVPAEAGFLGTARYFYKADGQMVEQRFRQIVASTAEAYGITAGIEWDDFADPLVSDAALAAAVAQDVPQYASLAPIHPSMAGEDFCEYAQRTRLLFAFIGSNGAPGHYGLHSPHFIGLDGELQAAAEFYVNAALRVLKECTDDR
ncbi:M20 metallopeptidase family protein [Bifidobacterium sp.]|jgi:amidohydrolase|uniref:M20 metallopeptidase family protein n=1 Tax=Bifidobacterium sp. TaxID=41200 RepID=UPI0025BCF3E6|nr:amidohydrolase [Bifidobacterium sp.]MCH4210038.1 amidohydrolase [Bifidobacterium sp.]MCI1225440.1 amidohydrolase [Bifidobacterium sp.]